MLWALIEGKVPEKRAAHTLDFNVEFFIFRFQSIAWQGHPLWSWPLRGHSDFSAAAQRGANSHGRESRPRKLKRSCGVQFSTTNGLARFFSSGIVIGLKASSPLRLSYPFPAIIWVPVSKRIAQP